MNGYSGFQPNGYSEYMQRISTFPSDQSLGTLKAIKVNYVIIHLDRFEEQNIAKTSDTRIQLIQRFDNDLVFRVK